MPVSKKFVSVHMPWSIAINKLDNFSFIVSFGTGVSTLVVGTCPFCLFGGSLEGCYCEGQSCDTYF